MQKIADEMAAARRRPTKKGRQDVDTKLNDTHLEDVTEGEPGAPAPDAPQQQQTEGETVAKTSAQRSKEWRENQKKKKAKAAKPTRARRATAPAGDKASVKAESGGGKINGGRTVFLTVPLELAQEAFTQLLDTTESRRTQAADTDAEAALAARANTLQKIVNRLA